VHADNARQYTSKVSAQSLEENRMKLAPHPRYSPDLVPSDLYLFAYVKGCLAGLSFEGAKRLLAAGQAVLERIEKVTLQAVFLEWMDGSSRSEKVRYRSAILLKLKVN
jgi:hypothetical protein